MEKVTQFIQKEAEEHSNLVVLGDFNVAPEDSDVHDPKAWEGGILVSEPERKALSKMFANHFHDAFHLFPQEPETYTWWDFRTAAFGRNAGLRIDLIYVSDALKEKCKACKVDVEPRRNERPSDHTPVVAEFEL